MKMIKRSKSRLLPILIVSILLIIVIPILLTAFTTKSSSSKTTTSGSYNAGYLAGSAKLAEVQSDLDTALDAIDVLQEQIVEYHNAYNTAITEYSNNQATIQRLTSQNETLTAQNQTLSAEVSGYYNYTYSVTITFVVDGSFYCEGKAREGGTLLVFPTPPTKEGFTFTGWTLNSPNDLDPIPVTSSTIFNTATTVYANFLIETQPPVLVSSSFTLGDLGTFYFDDGMTWSDWVDNSVYNTIGAEFVYTGVLAFDGAGLISSMSSLMSYTGHSSLMAGPGFENPCMITYNGQAVLPTDYIIGGAVYSYDPITL